MVFPAENEMLGEPATAEQIAKAERISKSGDLLIDYD